MDTIRPALKFDYYFSIDCVGKSGSLAMLWNESTSIQVMLYTRWHISIQWDVPLPH